ncbi:uncharacterized protein LOC128236009 [Mya arenaria]|uniref:uncharacterized protein LOC128236009 n=1 Tax=Mya arenaria TaxID=6604 RepID=UPI0022E19275|nr:uncharacterized protein LOC128236009 [Mya arenaria]
MQFRMISDYSIYAFSILTFIILKASYSSSQPTQAEAEYPISPDLDDRINKIKSLYSFLDDEEESIPEKRRSLFRFGKRRSLFRFGKRGTILRFGKRPAYDAYLEDEYLPYAAPDVYYPNQPNNLDIADKRSSLFRFGKKSVDNDLKDYVRSEKKKTGAHVPWRFGREEDYYYSKD